jgi:hypothetical protein
MKYLLMGCGGVGSASPEEGSSVLEETVSIYSQ